MSKARPNAVLVPIAVYAALVFASRAGTAPLWLDELQQLVLRRESVAALLQWVQSNPRASPLPYLAQRAVVDLFGTSAYVVRLPAALFLALPLQFRYGSSRAVRAREGGTVGARLSMAHRWH